MSEPKELSEEALRFIRKHHHRRDPADLARELGLKVGQVKRAIRRLEQQAGTSTQGSSGSQVGLWLSALAWTLLALILITGVSLTAYAGTWQHGYHFDDGVGITKNPDVRDLDQAFSSFPSTRWLTTLSFALNYRFNQYWLGEEKDDQLALHAKGLDLMAFHVTNVAIHIFASLMVFLLGVAVLQTPRMRGGQSLLTIHLTALGAALIFATHPLQTQAVTYLVQRAESLCALMYLGSLWAYTAGRIRHEAVARRLADGGNDNPPLSAYLNAAISTPALLLLYGLALGFGGLCMLSKLVSATLPAAILLIEICFFGWRAWIKALIPIALASGLFLAVALYLQGFDPSKFIEPDETLPIRSPVQYFLSQLRVFPRYVGLMFVPFGQSVDHDIIGHQAFFVDSIEGTPALWDLLVTLAAAALTLSALATAIWAHLRGQSLVTFAILGFYLVLSPTSSFLVLPDLMFEHRVYLPLAFVSLAVVGTAARQLPNRTETLQTLLTVTLVTVVGLTFLTRLRNQVWLNDITLWGDAAQRVTTKPRPHSNLGLAWQRNQSPDLNDRLNELAKAEQHFIRALEIQPEFTKARNNLGMIYVEKGSQGLDLHRHYLRQARQLESKGSSAASISARQAADKAKQQARAMFQQAEDTFRKVIEYNDEDFVAYNNIANMYHAYLAQWDPTYEAQSIPLLHTVLELSVKKSNAQWITHAILGDLYARAGGRARDPSAKRSQFKLAEENYVQFLERTERYGHDKRPYASDRLASVRNQLKKLSQ